MQKGASVQESCQSCKPRCMLQVILLRALRGRLCDALAKVHNGAALLNMRAGSEAARSLSAAEAAAAAQPCADGPAPEERERLLQTAREAALKCALSVSAVSHGCMGALPNGSGHRSLQFSGAHPFYGRELPGFLCPKGIDFLDH